MTRLTQLVSIVLAVAALSVMSCVSTQPALRMLTYNIHHGEGMDGRIDLDRIAHVIHEADADLVTLQEVDCGVERTNRIDQPKRLAELASLRMLIEHHLESPVIVAGDLNAIPSSAVIRKAAAFLLA
ncbi:MAG: hypothetical protein GXP29_07870 [Planctomycetes bacterium]|nr:hypothetical protein [Planctomycetota bacterium]